MATSSGVVCEICEAQHITKSANVWCPECEEGMCSECEKHHSFAKATRKHGIISIENYLKLQSSISKIATYCNEHNLKYQNYCPQDDQICCSVCISEYHKNCCGLKSLQEIVKTFKASAFLENIDQSLKDMMYNIDSIMNEREQNLTAIEKQRKLFHAEIKQIRQKVNTHLDSLEEQILMKLNAAETEIKSKLNTLMSQLKNKRKSVQTLHTNISALKEYASDLQIFLGSKLLETEVDTENKYLQSLFQDDSLHQNELKFSISEKISDILTTVTAFGSVSLGTSKSCTVYKTDKEKQAQILSVVPYPPRSIDSISFSLKSQFQTVPQDIIQGFTVSPSGLMVYVDNTGKLCILNTNGSSDLIKKKFSYYNDVTFIADSTVAVSSDNAIEIINIDSKVTERVIRIQGNCYGIRSYNGKLICNVITKGIQEVQLSNGQITDLVKQSDIKNWSFLAIHDDKIYQTTSDHFVRCYTMKGEKLWEHILHQNQNVDAARGIAVDINGIIYVAIYNKNSIALISPDGRRCRPLQIKDTKSPWNLHINAITNSLTVTSFFTGQVLLYDIC